MLDRIKTNTRPLNAENRPIQKREKVLCISMEAQNSCKNNVSTKTWFQSHSICTSKYCFNVVEIGSTPYPYAVCQQTPYPFPHPILSVWHLTISASWGVGVEPIPTAAKKSMVFLFASCSQVVILCLTLTGSVYHRIHIGVEEK